ncbi:hypothetical protein [Mucilaginibacter sp. FT3.2]|uniref:hypothetical protein n=1 Tax=Mucilaginibacter sp. FT3.2 TaxID=2723090 RepID=UPI00160A98A0|nr:hypothetical protein [Mucilaginibacter sp. FT3.2]MBB6231491.1 hypothetical protein [Mucilaginibacter sp. FT3.2]
MRKINLGTEERNWLKPLLQQRIDHFKTVEADVPLKYLANTESALSKIITNEFPTLREWERVMCSSVTNEKLDFLYQTTELPDAFSLADSTPGYLAQLAEIDLAEGLKQKFGRKKDVHVRRYERKSYKEYLAQIEKLKQSDMIYISGSTNISPYKIGFVYQQSELCVFELRNKIELHSLGFSKIPTDASKYGKQYFQAVTTRKQALERFEKHNDDEYVDGQLHFLKTVLN